ncbi:hypothetical protein GTQ99_11035 [Kineococcus sp. T13]|uniref:hypothetical protein n=1 Tax=Kineococcus vitellinus TaxID=2696565 RepID=UPI001413630D|nr:hypothetical protein [Kineococcus vitellinus]NAZ75942.1 hypothetical protein [Kineococcus vitellinus]
MTLVDLVGRSGGDSAGLSSLAALLHRCADALRGSCPPPQVAAVREAAAAAQSAAQDLRGLPVPVQPHDVEAVERVLADALRGPLTTLADERTP